MYNIFYLPFANDPNLHKKKLQNANLNMIFLLLGQLIEKDFYS